MKHKLRREIDIHELDAPLRVLTREPKLEVVLTPP